MSEEILRPEKHASVRLGTFVLLVILVAIAFGGAGYLFGKKGSTKTVATATPVATASISTTTSKTAIGSATTTATDATSSWKTYTNDKYGYSFKYPADWTAKYENSILKLNNPENQALKDKIDAGMYGEGYSPTVSIETFASVSDFVNYGNDQKTSTKSFTDYINGRANKGTLNQIALGGVKAYEFEDYGFAGTYYNISCEHNSKLYEVTIQSDKKSLTNTENQILSTFQFTK